MRWGAAADEEPVPVDELDEGVADGVTWNGQQDLEQPREKTKNNPN